MDELDDFDTFLAAPQARAAPVSCARTHVAAAWDMPTLMPSEVLKLADDGGYEDYSSWICCPAAAAQEGMSKCTLQKHGMRGVHVLGIDDVLQLSVQRFRCTTHDCSGFTVLSPTIWSQLQGQNLHITPAIVVLNSQTFMTEGAYSCAPCPLRLCPLTTTIASKLPTRGHLQRLPWWVQVRHQYDAEHDGLVRHSASMAKSPREGGAVVLDERAAYC